MISGTASLVDRLPSDLIPPTAAHALPVDHEFVFQLTVSEGFEIQEATGDRYHCRTWPDAIECLRGKIHEAVAALATQFTFVHCGVVASGNQVILLPGRSFAGKTTLTMSLVDAGAVYFSDEYALIDSQGLVHPFPRIPHVRGRVPTVSKIRIPSTYPLPVGLVVMSSYDPTARWQPDNLSVSQCLFGLIDNTVGIRANPEIHLRNLKQVATTSSAYASLRGEAGPVAQAILSLLHHNDQTTFKTGAH